MIHNFDNYRENGRELYVEFKCGRCSTVYMRPLSACVPSHAITKLTNLQKPPTWEDANGRLLCGECAEKLRRFMDGEELRSKGGANHGDR